MSNLVLLTQASLLALLGSVERNTSDLFLDRASAATFSIPGMWVANMKNWCSAVKMLSTWLGALLVDHDWSLD